MAVVTCSLVVVISITVEFTGEMVSSVAIYSDYFSIRVLLQITNIFLSDGDEDDNAFFYIPSVVLRRESRVSGNKSLENLQLRQSDVDYEKQELFARSEEKWAP